jgi:hypothetical protein
MLPTKFRFIWPSSFRGGEFKKMTNQKKEMPAVLASDWSIPKKYFPLKPLGQMSRIYVGSSYGRPYQKKEMPAAAMFVNGSG